jgi:hypothetical protein
MVSLVIVAEGRKNLTWSGEWKRIVWSDEKKFNLDGPDGFAYYWHDLRKEKLLFSRRAQGGGSVMIWAAFGWNGVSDVVFVDGRMNAAGYQNILQEHLLPAGATLGGSNWTFQQDNASIHTARTTKEWFASNNIDLIDWPSRSPDLNPIENLWGLLVRRVYANGRQFATAGDLKAAIRSSWDEITEAERQSLINSLPNRLFNVIRANGGYSNY